MLEVFGFACVGAAITAGIAALYATATFHALARRASTTWIEWTKSSATSRRIR